MIAQRSIVKFAFGVWILSLFTIITSDTSWAGTRCPAQVGSVAQQKRVDPPAEIAVLPDDSAFQYKNWKSVEYLNRPIAGYLCDGANKVQIICLRQ